MVKIIRIEVNVINFTKAVNIKRLRGLFPKPF